MTIFEAVILSTVALASTLLMFVGKKTLDSNGALQIYMIMGSSLAGLLAFYESPLHGARYLSAVVGIPLSGMAFEWIFGPVKMIVQQQQHPHAQ